ncbi:MAG: hypothetical protein GDA56_01535 [Hormoscilla sp. GM7CHS1pb]|nr:hypothetical protein [Hormoscilla sp. GM7CHS1pb]
MSIQSFPEMPTLTWVGTHGCATLRAANGNECLKREQNYLNRSRSVAPAMTKITGPIPIDRQV